MAENKNSFLMYAEYISTVEKLSEEEAGRLFKHLLRYVNDQSPEAPDRLTEIVFEPIKQDLKRNLKKWDAIKDKRSIAGALGGKKSGEARSNSKQNKANEAIALKPKQNKANEAVNVNVNGNVIDKSIVVVEEVEDAREEIFDQKIEEIEIEEIPAAVYIDEEEKIAAAEFLKRHSSFTLIQKNQTLKPPEVLKLFDVFFDQKTALNELKGKSKDDLIKNFYWWVPKHIQANRRNDDSNTDNRPKGNRQVSSGPDAKRADRHATLGKLRDLLQGTAPP